MVEPYIPVSCDLHDQLEAAATLRQECNIIYRSAVCQENRVHGCIIDIYSANKADFLKLEDGTEIRLDHIISLNNQQSTACSTSSINIYLEWKA